MKNLKVCLLAMGVLLATTDAQNYAIKVPVIEADGRQIFWLGSPAMDVSYTLPAGFNPGTPKVLELFISVVGSTNKVIASVPLSPNAASAVVSFTPPPSQPIAVQTTVALWQTPCSGSGT